MRFGDVQDLCGDGAQPPPVNVSNVEMSGGRLDRLKLMRSNKWLWANLSLSAAVAAAAALVWPSDWLWDEAPFPFALALLVLAPMFAVIALAAAADASKSLIGFIARLGLALVAGLLSTIPLAMVAEYRGWRYLNGWAQAHGTFVVVAPVLVVVAYIALGFVPGLRDPFEPQ